MPLYGEFGVLQLGTTIKLKINLIKFIYIFFIKYIKFFVFNRFSGILVRVGHQ